MHSSEKKKVIKQKKEKMLWEELYWVLFVLLMLDGFVSTPLVLYFVENSYEANPLHSFYYGQFGIGYFFVSTPVIGLILYFFFFGLQEKLSLWYRIKWPNIFIISILIILETIVNINNWGVFLGQPPILQ